MDNIDIKNHWETIYEIKKNTEFSWFQEKPETSLELFKTFNISKESKIIDVGAGDSYFVDHLIALGYSNISVLDISEKAIERAKKRLGEKAETVTWIVCNITNFEPIEKYDYWHDRAVFHFLTNEEDKTKYIHLVNKSLNSDGILSIGTFSENGPLKCSGIEITRYSENELSSLFSKNLHKISCIRTLHPTPFNTQQEFTFCCFKKN